MLDYYRFKTVSDLFMQGRIEEARLELAELQRRYVALCDENITFKMQVQEYEDILYLARNLVLEGEFYWLVTGSIKQGPFCPTCYNRDGLLMRLAGETGDRFCTVCRQNFADQQARQMKVAVASQDFADAEFIPIMEAARRKAKVIPFSK